MTLERNVGEFNRDVAANRGYVYTATDRLSCRLSNGRMSEAVLELADVTGRRVLDVGCGDGTYTLELARAGARSVVGFDAAEAAVEAARERAREMENVRFEVRDVYSLKPPECRYDVAVVRGLLHHLDHVREAIAGISRMARSVVVVEPNGYNPVLKVIEKVSPYHRRHDEKSYRPAMLDHWFIEAGGEIERSLYIGLVPNFCPDTVARICKVLEPFIEKAPLLRKVGCGQYVQRVRFD